MRLPQEEEESLSSWITTSYYEYTSAGFLLANKSISQTSLALLVSHHELDFVASLHNRHGDGVVSTRRYLVAWRMMYPTPIAV